MKYPAVRTLAGISMVAIAATGLLAYPLLGQSVIGGSMASPGTAPGAQAVAIDGIQDMHLPVAAVATASTAKEMTAKVEPAVKPNEVAKGKAKRPTRRHVRVRQPRPYDVAANRTPQQ